MLALVETPIFVWPRFAALTLFFLFFGQKIAAQPPGCVDSSLINPDAVCITLWDPVCGCNGVTYGNSCEAVNFGGVTSWTGGPCNPQEPCDGVLANFSFDVTADPLTLEFINLSTVGSGMFETALWSFGDGVTSTQWAPVYSYAAPGVYTVCLTVTAVLPAGQPCEKTVCQPVATGQDCPSGCFFSIYYALDGVTLHAWLLPDPTDPLPPDSVQWTLDNSPTGPIQSEFFYEFSGPGEHVLCATYPKPGGGSCTACKAIRVSAACVDSSLIDEMAVCTAIYDPVCGCDGVTYANDCEALYHHGVTNWTPGECGSVCADPDWIDDIGCPEIYDPVCGCDGVTYGNACEALHYFGITAWKAGACCTQPVECKAAFILEKLPNRTVRLGDISTNAESWTLDFGDGFVFYGPFDSLLHTYATPGVYAICLTISDFTGSCTHTYCETVDFSVSATDEPAQTARLFFSPNPAREKTTVRVSGATPQRVIVYDVFGKIVLEKTVETAEFELGLGGLPSGVCLVVVETDRGAVVGKLLVRAN